MKINKKLRRIARRNKKERYSLAEIVGAGSGAVLFNKYGKGPTRKISEGLGEVVDGYRIISGTNGSLGQDQRTNVRGYLQEINTELSQEFYEKSSRDYFNKIFNKLEESLDFTQRKSTKLPGMNTKPVKKIVGLKSKILSETKSWFTGDDKVKIQENQNYQINYNKIKDNKIEAVKKMVYLKDKISDYSKKMKIKEIRFHEIPQKDLKTLEKLAKEYVQTAEFIENTNNLDPNQIILGEKNKEYQTLIKQADDYNLQNYDSSHWGDTGVGIGFALAVLLGYKSGKVAQKIINTTSYIGKNSYNAGKKIVETTRNAYDKIKPKNLKGK